MRRWPLALGAALLGCSDTATPVSPAATSRPLATHVAPALADPCAASDEHNARVRAQGARDLEKARARGDVKEGWEQPPLPPLPCVRTPQGAWALEAGPISHGGVTSAPLTLVHLSNAGVRTTLEVEVPVGVPLSFTCCHPTNELRDVHAVDLDGQGELELSISVTHHDPEGGVATHGAVLGLDRGAIVVRRRSPDDAQPAPTSR